MFERNKRLSSISASVDSLYEIYSSINTPLVAVEENPTEQTRCFIVVLRDKKNRYNFYIYLRLLNSEKGVFYVKEGVVEENFSEVKNAAFDFAESMGFLMERVFSVEEGTVRAEECLNAYPMFKETGSAPPAEEVIKLDEVAVVEPEVGTTVETKIEEKNEETSEVEILLDEVEKIEKKVEEKVIKPSDKKPVVGKIQVKSIPVQAEGKEFELKAFATFFRFLASC